MTQYSFNYQYDDHTSVPFKLIELKPSLDRDLKTEAHRHNYYELFVFKEKGFEHHIDFVKFNVKKNSIHLVPPGRVHLLRRDTKTVGYVLLFSREFYHFHLNEKQRFNNEMQLNYDNSTYVHHLEQRSFQKVVRLIEFMADEVQAEGNDNELIGHYLNTILQYLLKDLNKNKEANSQSSELSLRFMFLLNQKFHELLKVQDYCKKLNVGPDNLNLVCKKNWGKTTKELIKERRLLEGKRLLMHSDLSIKEIAYHLGTNDPQYFSRWIQENCGSSPSALRTSLRNQF